MAWSKEARAARRAYQKEWYANHPGKNREYMERYWKKRAEKQLDLEESEE